MKKYSITLALLAFVNIILAQSINVATFNIRQRNTKDIGNMWADRKDYVIQLIKFHEFDIFGTQEGFIDQLQDIATGLPNFKYIGVGRDDGHEKGEHSAIFYNTKKFKVLDSGTFWLSENDIFTPQKGWDAVLPRICTWGIFKNLENGKKFILMNTHFDHIGKEARKQSALLMLTKAKEFAKNLPLIIMGDLNVNQNDEAYFTLSKSNIVADTYDLAQYNYASNSTFHNWGKSIKYAERIDHIFTTSQFEILKYGILTDTFNSKYPSDHFPVMVKLKWK